MLSPAMRTEPATAHPFSPKLARIWEKLTRRMWHSPWFTAIPQRLELGSHCQSPKTRLVSHQHAGLQAKNLGYNQQSRGVAQPGSAPALGAGGRRFESYRPDQPSLAFKFSGLR